MVNVVNKLVSKCRKCGVNINFKEIQGNPVKGMYVKPQKRWVPINEVDSRNHFDSCMKKDGKDGLVFCVECGNVNHFVGVFLLWGDWLLHREVFGHVRYRRWSKDVNKCRCLKYCL